MNYNKTNLNRNTDSRRRVLCQLKELGSCFGCCGNHFKEEKDVMDGIKKNSFLLKQLMEKYHGDIKMAFQELNLEYYGLRECGVCHMLINLRDYPFIAKFYDLFSKEMVDKGLIFGCPLHPILNKGKDFRTCEIEHECKSYFLFEKMSRKNQDKFIEFLKSKKLSSYDYSMGLDNGSLIEEFLKQQTSMQKKHKAR